MENDNLLLTLCIRGFKLSMKCEERFITLENQTLCMWFVW